MDNFRESLKIENTKKNKNIDLIIQYIEKEKEINRNFDEKDGIDITARSYEPYADATVRRLENLLSYREIRTKQAFVSKVSRGDYNRKTREKIAEIDRDRREKHNLALISFRGLNDFAEKHGLEKIYKGRLLTEKEIKEHKSETYDIRQEMTDAFLAILLELGEYSVKDSPIAAKEIQKLQDRIYKMERDYGIKSELKKDDGDILFKDFEDEISEYR